MKAIKYPKIGQLKDVVYEVRRRATFDGLDGDGNPQYKAVAKMPTLEFEGTVKLHGTNASVVVDGGEVRYQSRNRVITKEDDNAGFAAWAESGDWLGYATQFSKGEVPVIIYGEWCGEGIQSGVAISSLKKRFVIFSVLVGENWASNSQIENSVLPNMDGVDMIYRARTWTKTIDFNNPQLVQNELKELTDRVESECPYAMEEDISGTGEGIVWKCTDPEYQDLMFKVKGEKHSKSRVKTLNEVDLKALTAANELASKIMTIERMNQGIDYVKEMGLDIRRQSLGPYLKHVVSDCIAEESLAISEAELTTKQMGKPLSEIAKNYFLQLEEELAA